MQIKITVRTEQGYFKHLRGPSVSLQQARRFCGLENALMIAEMVGGVVEVKVRSETCWKRLGKNKPKF